MQYFVDYRNSETAFHLFFIAAALPSPPLQHGRPVMIRFFNISLDILLP